MSAQITDIYVSEKGVITNIPSAHGHLLLVRVGDHAVYFEADKETGLVSHLCALLLETIASNIRLNGDLEE